MQKSIFISSTNLRILRNIDVLKTMVPIRHFRKPKWVPMAKSKMYKIYEVEDQPKEESQEILNELLTRHKVYSKSLWSWQKKLLSESQTACDSEGTLDVELKRIIRENEEVNVRVKSHRDKQLVEEWVQVVEEITRQKAHRDNENDRKLELAKQRVLADMEKLKTSINLEDLDEAIEKAMSSEVDYNFAIDKAGNVIRGRNNNAPSV